MAVVQSPFAMTQSKVFNVIQHAPQPGAPKPPKRLAPAPERGSVLVAASADLRCKRKVQFVPYGGPQQQPASVARRNARERNRVKQVNNGFATLRQHIPPSVAAAFAPQGPGAGRAASKKLSKVETLRLAVEYIRSLKQMIEEHEGEAGEGGYYAASPEYQPYPVLLQTPTCSEASSPSPSHSSEGSFSAASGYNALYHQENFENYEPKSPEDEELLDAIFSWQQNE